MKPRLAARMAPPLALALALVLALAACGGGGEDADEVEAISNVVAESVTSGEPSKCRELMTADFVDQNSNQSGAAALEECEADADDSSDDPDEVTVAAVEIDGPEASAEVAFDGGGFDGQTVAVALVEEGGQWKLDRMTGFASYDAEALAETLEARFAKISEQITQAQIACLGDAIREASEAQAEELLLSGDASAFVEFAEACE